MMYETIYKALVEVGLEGAYSPQDYLNFFCLGNREAPDGDPALAGSPHPPNSPQVSHYISPKSAILCLKGLCNLKCIYEV